MNAIEPLNGCEYLLRMYTAEELHDIGYYAELLKGLANLAQDEALERERRQYIQDMHQAPATEILGRLQGRLKVYGEESAHAFIRNVIAEAFENPHADLENFINLGQVNSKRWLLYELYKAVGSDLGEVWILGGWYGALSAMILQDNLFNVKKILSFDMDANAVRMANKLNDHFRASGTFESRVADMLTMDYSSPPNLIVNTSCEHIRDFDQWLAKIPLGTKLVLQSNDYFGEPDHVNCVADLQEFERQAPLSKLKYSGSLKAKKYTRFMLIGEK